MGWLIFSYKGSDGFEGHRISVATTQLCPYHIKTAIDNTKTDVCGGVPIKLYLWTLKFDFQINLCHELIVFKSFSTI